MEAKNLRIGNIVYQPNRIGKVDEIWQEAVKLKGYKNGYDYEHTKPIPLTDEWFENCGFKKDETDWWHQKEIGFKKYDDNTYEEYSNNITIEYVHELQNLFFVLTGTELEINALS